MLSKTYKIIHRKFKYTFIFLLKLFQCLPDYFSILKPKSIACLNHFIFYSI